MIRTVPLGEPVRSSSARRIIGPSTVTCAPCWAPCSAWPIAPAWAEPTTLSGGRWKTTPNTASIGWPSSTGAGVGPKRTQWRRLRSRSVRTLERREIATANAWEVGAAQRPPSTSRGVLLAGCPRGSWANRFGNWTAFADSCPRMGSWPRSDISGPRTLAMMLSGSRQTGAGLTAREPVRPELDPEGLPGERPSDAPCGRRAWIPPISSGCPPKHRGVALGAENRPSQGRVQRSSRVWCGNDDARTRSGQLRTLALPGRLLSEPCLHAIAERSGSALRRAS